MRLTLIVIGRDRGDPLVEAADEYLDRVRRAFPVDVVELKEEPARASTPKEVVKSREAESILAKVPSRARLVALDERGDTFTSTELATRLEKAMLRGDDLAVVIGGPLGLDPGLLARAQERWSLSRLTLPHRLARLVVSEQLYRATSILRREPYHK